jgi:hypothetical protein
MKIHFLLYSAGFFLWLGWKQGQESPLYLFFAVHLLMLALSSFCFKQENRNRPGTESAEEE